jgi:hypothetical protein
MYALISSGKVVEFPLSLNKWRLDNPLISLPEYPTEGQLNEQGIYIVQPTLKPSNKHTSNYQNTAVQNEDGIWVESWTETPASEQEIEERTVSKIIEVRQIRNKLLQETDWVSIKAKDDGEDVPTDWKTYRQALRDITTQDGFPHNITWPTKP